MIHLYASYSGDAFGDTKLCQILNEVHKNIIGEIRIVGLTSIVVDTSAIELVLMLFNV